VFDHSQRKDHQQGSSILKLFSPTVARQAFRLFDRDKNGSIDFKEFCCALSIICLGSTNEKLRFTFDLFDIDRDSYLSKKEQSQLVS